MLNYLSLSFKEIVRRKRRTLYTLSGVALAAAFLIFAILASSCLKTSFNKALADVGADIVVQTHGDPCVWAPVKLPTNLNPIPVEMLDKAANIKGVKKISGILICWAFNGEEGNLHPTVVAGVEAWERELGPLKLSADEGSGNALVKGRYLNDLDLYQTVIDYDFAKFLKSDIGSRIYLGPQEFEIVGIIKTGREARIAGAQAFIPLRAAQEMLKKGRVVDTIFIRLAGDADPIKAAGELKKLFGANASVTTSYDYSSAMMGVSAFTNMFMAGMVAFLLFLSVIFSMKSISSSISERIKEIAIMKAVGWTNRNLRTMLLVEASIIGFLGSSLGAGLGVVLAWSYVKSVSLRLPEVLAAYPPCSSTPPKLDVAVIGFHLNAAAIIITIVGLTLLCAVAAVIAARNFKGLECAKGMRSL